MKSDVQPAPARASVIRPRWLKVFRDLRLHLPRTALVILAIVVGLTGAGAVLDTWSLMRRVTAQEYHASNPASATLRVDSVSAATVASIRAMPAIAAVQARRTVSGVARTRADPTPRSLVLFALDDFTTASVGKIVGEQGEWPPRTGAVAVEHSSLDFASVALGDSITLQMGDDAAVTVAVSGVARDVGLAPGWMEHVVYAFAAPSTLIMLGAPSTFNELQIIVRDRTLDRDGTRRVAYEVKQQLEREGYRVMNVDVPVPGQHIHAAQINSLLFTQGAFGAIALLLSGILVINLVAAMLAGQVREIGVMKVLGATSQQLAVMYLVPACALGLIASAISIPLAAIIGRAYAEFTAEMLNFSTTGIAIPNQIFVWQLAVGVVFPILAATIPVWRGCRISVGDALRDVGIEVSGAPARVGGITRLLGSMSSVSRPLLLSLRNAFRKRQRMMLTLLTLATGGAVYIGALNLKESVRGAVDLLFGVQQFDLSLQLARPTTPDSVERAISAISGVAHEEAWSATRASVAHADSTTGNAFPISAPTPGTLMLRHDMVAGRWLLDRDARSLVVNKRLLDDEPSLHVGDSVALNIGGKLSAWQIVGVVESGTSPTAYAPRNVVAAMTLQGRVDRVVVAATSRTTASQLELMQRIRGVLADGGFVLESGQLMIEQRRVVEDHLLMVASFLGAMSQLMIVVGGLALASTMGMAVLERTREIGVMRAIGARHGAIMMMIQIEGLVIALLGWALAIPLSLPVSIVLGKAFGRIMLPVPLTYIPEFSGIVEWLGVVLVVSLVACAVPAWRATRITTRAALAYE